jgi:hypothetical protein
MAELPALIETYHVHFQRGNEIGFLNLPIILENPHSLRLFHLHLDDGTVFGNDFPHPLFNQPHTMFRQVMEVPQFTEKPLVGTELGHDFHRGKHLMHRREQHKQDRAPVNLPAPRCIELDKVNLA